VNKQDLVNEVAKHASITKAAAAAAVDAVLESIKQALSTEDTVRLINFGTFKKKRVQAKTVRNPRTGDPVKVPEHNRVTFSPGEEMKQSANK
jgi:DNA-binding protein HU-beta